MTEEALAVSASLAGERLDRVVALLAPELSRSAVQRLIADNADMPQDEYGRRYDELQKQYHAAEDEVRRLQEQKVTKRFQADVMECFMTELQTVDTSLPLEFSERLWFNLIDKVTVYADRRVVVRFRNGAEISDKL